jgi:putative ABC transport system permease protein
MVSPCMFRLLGVQAQVGRAFLAEEGEVGRDHVVLLGDGIWRRRFAADPAVVGRQLVMNGQGFTIVGVLPRGFQYPRDAEIWTPLAFSAADLAKTYWPHQDPIGRRIHRGGRDSQAPWMTVVGVMRHVRYRTLESPSRVELYWPYAQTPFALGTMSLAIRSAAAPANLAGGVRRAVQALDPDQAVYSLRTMAEVEANSLARRRLSMSLLTIFAGLALLLAAVGIYGVMSYAVAQRVHEIGIRMALGSRGGQVVALVLRRSGGLTLAGIVTGVTGSLLLTRFIGSLLFAVKAYDPATLAAVAALLLLVALTASFIPARRAAAVDPVKALRVQRPARRYCPAAPKAT